MDRMVTVGNREMEGLSSPADIGVVGPVTYAISRRHAIDVSKQNAKFVAESCLCKLKPDGEMSRSIGSFTLQLKSHTRISIAGIEVFELATDQDLLPSIKMA